MFKLDCLVNYSEMVEVLELFKCDMSDSEYEEAKAAIDTFMKFSADSWTSQVLAHSFQEAVRTQDHRRVIQFFNLLSK